MGMLVKPQTDQTDGVLRPLVITPETAGWQYVSFAVYHLTRGQTLGGAADGRETAVVVLSGTGKAELNGQSVGQLGERLSIFENKAPYALYLSEDASYQIECTSDGNWSSFPPHKHDTENPPHEAYLEETYYHHVQPADGFAFQRVYNYEGFDEAVAVQDGDLVLVPKGYHVVPAAPGCDLYYLNIMAGPHCVWNYQVDPAFHRLLPRRARSIDQSQRRA